MREIPLRAWRVTSALPSGIHVFVDPTREEIKIFQLDVDPSTESGVASASEGDDQNDFTRVNQVKNVFDLEDDLPF